MSGSLPQLQEQAAARADEFCARYGRPRRRRGSKGRCGWSDDSVLKRTGTRVEMFYRPRDPEASALYQVVRQHFEEFERVYPERYEKRYGYLTLVNGSDNHEIFDPLDFLAEFTQHIPNKGEHQIRYYGWYSNKSRGMRANAQQAVGGKPRRHLTPEQLKRRLTWASLITAQEI